MNELRIAIIGTKFMGAAHAQAWRSAPSFFPSESRVILDTACGRDVAALDRFAQAWGWRQTSGDWAEVVRREEIDLVDLCTPNDLHRDPAVEALSAGRHVACEKPLAGTLDDARAMRDAARRAKRKGQRTFVWFNYRRCPALAFAWRLIRDGRLGRLYHVRAQYLQDWGGPETPMAWRFDAKRAGSGAHGDLNAHLVDLARFLTGDEIVEVSEALEETFIRTRDDDGKRRRSTVDDCVLFLARLKQGAVASFEATRLATGNLNRNSIEVNGEQGSIRFDFERMNELEWWDHARPEPERGWSRVHCTMPSHPYADSYWPPGHGLGYEHTFISQAADMIEVLRGGEPVVPLADFEDAYETQRVLEAALLAARERRAVELSEVK